MQGLIKTAQGWEYQSEKRRYSLYEGMCIESTVQLSSDILFIMDDNDLEKNTQFVDWVYGASAIDDSINREMWESFIKEAVEKYESKEGKE